MSNADKPQVIATRWWWVRHAPVREDNGCIYGQKDLGCDTSDHVVFEAVGKILPRNAVWYASNLKRTHQTASAIWAAGFPKPMEMPHVNAFAEQHLGEWQGLNRAAFLASRPVGSHWLTEVDERAPGGESFMDLYNRTCGAIERINAEQAGRDVIVVAHGGTIRAAVGLALGGQPEKGPRLRYRQLLGDAARSSLKRQLHRLAAADGQPAALDRGRFAQRDASAGRA
jgi:broad specificity phosphatase PhoE